MAGLARVLSKPEPCPPLLARHLPSNLASSILPISFLFPSDHPSLLQEDTKENSKRLLHKKLKARFYLRLDAELAMFIL